MAFNKKPLILNDFYNTSYKAVSSDHDKDVTYTASTTAYYPINYIINGGQTVSKFEQAFKVAQVLVEEGLLDTKTELKDFLAIVKKIEEAL